MTESHWSVLLALRFGQPLTIYHLQKAVETLVQSILLDPRVVAFKSSDARKDFMEQLAWQIQYVRVSTFEHSTRNLTNHTVPIAGTQTGLNLATWMLI
jgi:hypothetical protein